MKESLLVEKRKMHEGEGAFSPSASDSTAGLLTTENGEGMDKKLDDLPADDRLHQTCKIMHNKLHRHGLLKHTRFRLMAHHPGKKRVQAQKDFVG